MAEIILAKSAGFCFGVKRAVQEAERLADTEKGVINTYGELIHNTQEIERLKEKGLVPAETYDNIPSEKVIIRTHGVGEDVIEKLAEKGCEITDLTCPYVKKIQKIAKDASVSDACAGDSCFILIGSRTHPEVISILSYFEGEKFVFVI